MAEIHYIKTLHQLLDEDARKFTIAEIELQQALSGWILKTNSLKLKNILQKYHEQIRNHIKRFDIFFEEENIGYLNITNHIMKEFIRDTDEKLNNCADITLRDACLLSCIQTINHYKISAYGTAAAFANALEMSRTAVLFHEFEVNEKQIDDRLSQLAEHEINKEAISAVSLHK